MSEQNDRPSEILLPLGLAVVTALLLLAALLPGINAEKKMEEATQEAFTLLKTLEQDVYVHDVQEQMLQLDRTPLQAMTLPAYATRLRDALITGDAPVCLGRVPPITSTGPRERYLDRQAPDWRAVDQRLSTLPRPVTARRVNEIMQQIGKIRTVSLSASERAQRHIDERVMGVQELALRFLECDRDISEPQRVQTYLTGLRDTRLNQPAQPLNLSRSPQQGFSDTDLLCLSGSYDLNTPAVLAGEGLIAPDGQELPLPRPAPALVKLPERLITPADLQSAGCTLERQTELASRVRAVTALGR